MSKKPNILVMWGDDIGISNLSCYSDGLMGYETPNIDRIANEGMRFTDSYGQQSCTAGRAAFITGQSPYRTGLTKVIAELLKPLGYATGQFGKNHFGDLNKYMPTAHGFDEFFGNLYHLNAEEEPENVDYPPEEDFPEFHARFKPRGVMHSWAIEEDDPTEHPRWGRVGKQKIEDTGPLTKKRMETIDTELLPEAKRFIKEAHENDQPFFVWLNTTWMHFRVHPPEEILGQAGRWQSEYHDAMIEHRRYHRDVQHRQRPPHELLARCRHDTLPQREELQLGRRLPYPRDDPLAGQNPGGCGFQRDDRPPGLAAHAAGRRR
jgi:arylsulfatase